jgi:hypothetical protein
MYQILQSLQCISPLAMLAFCLHRARPPGFGRGKATSSQDSKHENLNGFAQKARWRRTLSGLAGLLPREEEAEEGAALKIGATI